MVLSKIVTGTVLALVLQGAGAMAQERARPGQPSPNFRQPRQVPDKLDLSRDKPSDKRRFRVALRPDEPSLTINRMHAWTVTVLDADGAPVMNATIGFDGGMPAHDHGFPTSPRVTRKLGHGKYLIEGVKFNMSGWWLFSFEIQAGDVVDRVSFNVVVAD